MAFTPINQLLPEITEDLEEKQNGMSEAAREGIAEAYRILGMEPKPQDDERRAA